jgi:hypothetical protein
MSGTAFGAGFACEMRFDNWKFKVQSEQPAAWVSQASLTPRNILRINR